MAYKVTWYDVLGVLPGAAAGEIQRQYDAKASLLRPGLIAGAPSPVVTAASRAQQILDAARDVLCDPANRARYDEAAGIRRSGGGLVSRESVPSQPGGDWSESDLIPGQAGSAVLGGLLGLTDWLTPHPHEPRHVRVPDVRGLFYSACLEIIGKLGLSVITVRLTEHPRPVDGLVVDQAPGPSAQVRRGRAVTVQVWHPPAGSADWP